MEPWHVYVKLPRVRLEMRALLQGRLEWIIARVRDFPLRIRDERPEILAKVERLVAKPRKRRLYISINGPATIDFLDTHSGDISCLHLRPSPAEPPRLQFLQGQIQAFMSTADLETYKDYLEKLRHQNEIEEWWLSCQSKPAERPFLCLILLLDRPRLAIPTKAC